MYGAAVEAATRQLYSWVVPWKPWTYLPDVLRKDYLLLALVKISVAGARSRAAAAARHLDAGFFYSLLLLLLGWWGVLRTYRASCCWWMVDTGKQKDERDRGQRTARCDGTYNR
jgi:hypothetical protein